MAIKLAVPLEAGLEKSRRMNDESNAGVSLAALPSGEQSPSAACGLHLGDTGVFSSMDDISQGWIKLHRKIWMNPWAKDPQWLAVWIYLLCQATHKPFDIVWCGKRLTLMPGQFISGRITIAQKTGVSSGKVWRILETLKSEQQIEQQSSNASSLFTIVKWTDYQQTEQPNEQRVSNERATGEQRASTNKKVKNIKKVEETAPQPPAGGDGIMRLPDAFALSVLNCPEFLEAWGRWLKHRAEIRHPVKPTSMEAQLKRLETLGVEDGIKALNHTIEKGWQGIVEPQKGTQPNGTKKPEQRVDRNVGTLNEGLAKQYEGIGRPGR